MDRKDRVFIIAEAGVNHNGSLALALQLVDAAAAAGADAVKFQTFRTEALVGRAAPKADYQKQSTGAAESQFDMLRRLELSPEAHHEILQHCRQRKIAFLSTPFDLQSIDLLLELGIELFKVPSGEITNLPYLRRIGGLGKKVILSTGMADLAEVGAALGVLTGAGAALPDITLLHCTTEYPAPLAEVNLRAMRTMGEAFGTAVGYSDHTEGIEIPVAAVALGASVIEKHFTLDRGLPGPDHRASLEPAELQAMVRSIRNVALALGDGKKLPAPCEEKNRLVIRKSIVAAEPIRQGERFSTTNLCTRRPAEGLCPMQWDEVIGRRAARDFQAGEPISL